MIGAVRRIVPRSSIRALVLALFALVVAATTEPSSTRAQEAPDDEALARATELHRRAADAIRRADFVQAESLEREALSLYAAAELAYNLALALRGQGKLREAGDTFDRLLRGEWGQLRPEAAASIERLRDEAREQVARLRVIVRGGAPVTLRLDGALVEEDLAPDTASEIPVDPGEHILSASAPDHETFERSIMLRPGANMTVEAHLTASRDDSARLGVQTAEDATITVEPPSRSSAVWWWVLGGTAVVAAGAVLAWLLITTEPEPQEDREGMFPVTATLTLP